MNFFKSVLGTPCKIDVLLDGDRQIVDVPVGDDKTEKFPLFIADETVKGKVTLTLEPGQKKIEHNGIKIYFVGTIKATSGNVFDFLSVVQELEAPGVLTDSKSWDFAFEKVDKPHESYNGINISLNYYLRVVVIRSLTNITKQSELWVRRYSISPEVNNNIKMEVGIEDCLHIEFEYNKSKYHLKDVIIGKIYFLMVRLNIKSMNISLIKRETTGTGIDMFTENRTIAKFEIMDGAPVRGEAIPVRFFLGAFDLTPSYKDIQNKFSVSYILNLVLVAEDERRYFKQREVTLWRREPTTEDQEQGYMRHHGTRDGEKPMNFSPNTPVSVSSSTATTSTPTVPPPANSTTEDSQL